MGPSGSGKSSLMNILTGMFCPLCNVGLCEDNEEGEQGAIKYNLNEKIQNKIQFDDLISIDTKPFILKRG